MEEGETFREDEGRGGVEEGKKDSKRRGEEDMEKESLSTFCS